MFYLLVEKFFLFLLYLLYVRLIMNKGVIIGIAIAVIIGIGAIMVSSNYSENTIKDINDSLNENTQGEPKQFTIGLEESVGFSEGP